MTAVDADRTRPRAAPRAQPHTQTAAVAAVTEEWRDPHLPTVFSRWHAENAALTAATIAAVVAEAGVAPGDVVLDVGCGSGFPALALAEAVGPEGQVTATDPSPVFVAAARENAARGGLTNLEVVQAAAAALPDVFATGSFDAATCHLVAMFFADVRADLSGIRRVLRAGARAAFVAWGPAAENAMFSAFWGAARPHLPPPTPSPAAPPPEVEPAPEAAPAASGDGVAVRRVDASAPDVASAPTADLPGPGPERFAAPGSLGAALRDAGFAEVREQVWRVDLVWPGPAESLRDFWLELTRLEAQVPGDRREALRANVLAAFRRYATGDGVRLPATIVLASGQG